MNILTNINQKLRKLEADREIKENGKKDLLYNVFNDWKNSKIWNVTAEELKLIRELGDMTKNYNLNINTPSGAVLMFARDFYKSVNEKERVKPYRFMRFSTIELEKYIQNSRFWSKQRTNYVTKSGTHMRDIAYINDQRKMVIFEYRDNIVLATKSSYYNFIRAYEGKEPKDSMFNINDDDMNTVMKTLDWI